MSEGRSGPDCEWCGRPVENPEWCFCEECAARQKQCWICGIWDDESVMVNDPGRNKDLLGRSYPGGWLCPDCYAETAVPPLEPEIPL